MTVSTLFDGTDDRITLSGNDISLSGAYTFLSLVHTETMVGVDTMSTGDDTGTERWTQFMNGLQFRFIPTGGNVSAGPTLAAPNAAGWYLYIVTRPAGAAQTCRFHIFDGRSWLHANGTANNADNTSGAISAIHFGAYQGNTEWFDGEMALHGIWSEETNDANCEALVDYNTITAKSNRQFLSGTSLLNGGTVNDIATANNDEVSRAGATTGTRDLPGWFTNFHNDATFPNITRWAAANGTTGNPALTNPTGATTGDLVIWFAAHDSGAAMSPSTSWTEIQADAANGTAVIMAIYAKVLTGTNDTLTITFGSSNDYACVGVLIPAARHSVSNVATDIYVGTAATGTSTTPDPPSLSPSPGSADYLWIVAAASDDDDNSNQFMPANFYGIGQAESAQSTTACMMSVAARLHTNSTLNPGTFTLAASEEWVANTIALRLVGVVNTSGAFWGTRAA